MSGWHWVMGGAGAMVLWGMVKESREDAKREAEMDRRLVELRAYVEAESFADWHARAHAIPREPQPATDWHARAHAIPREPQPEPVPLSDLTASLNSADSSRIEEFMR